MQRPSIVIPIAARTTSGVLFQGTGILAGYSLREALSPASTVTYIAGSASGANSANNAALAAGGAGTLNWVTGFEINGGGATAGAAISATLTGAAGGTLTYMFEVPTGAAVQLTPIIVEFMPPGIPAAALNSAITINVPAFGAGNTAASATIHGYTASSGAAGGVVTPNQTLVFDLLDGLDANGELIAPFAFPSGGFDRLQIGEHGPLIRRGIFLNMTAGTIKGALWLKI